MRITFVALGWEQLSISLLSALAKQQGEEVHLAFSASLFNDRYNLSIPALARVFDDRKDLLKTITKQKPDILCFSPLTGTYQWMLDVARQAKLIFPDVKVIFGGVHASAVPNRVLAESAIDYVCVGEGDLAFVQILESIKAKNFNQPIINTRHKSPEGKIIQGPQRGFIQNLDILPMFDKQLWENHVRLGDIYFTMASRGCPHRCSYCFNSFYADIPQEDSGPYIRYRSPGHVLQELRWAKNRYPLRVVEFEDDVFTFNKKWLKEFLEHYKKEIAVPFQCLSHPHFIDAEVVRWLSEADCRYIQLGVQSMDDEYKRKVMNRHEKAYAIEEALRLFQKYDIKVKVDHMFGLPGEPIGSQQKALDLYLKFPPFRIQTFWINFLPGTTMTQQAFDQKLLDSDDLENINDGLIKDFYRNTTKIDDPQKIKTYKVYEMLFKLISLLPKSFVRKMRTPALKYFPSSLCALITFWADVINGLARKNPDHITYARFYLFQIKRHFKAKCGLSTQQNLN